MANTTTKKETVKKTTTPKSKETKVMKKETVKKEVAKQETVVKEVVKNKEKKSSPVITVMDNDTLKKLFQENGCATRTNASNSSNVVYNTFGTQSRVLQQKKSYQLLLTNGHKSTKQGIVDTDNNDTERFMKFYEALSDEQKAQVAGFDSILNTKLSASEMPRERTVKLTSYELLVQFIQYMAQFEENKLAVAK